MQVSHCCLAVLQADSLLEGILERCSQQIQAHAALNARLPAFTSSKTFQNFNEINELQMQIKHQNNRYQVEAEPQPLASDSLLPTSAEIDSCNPFRTANPQLTEASRMTLPSKRKENIPNSPSKEAYLKLDMPEPEPEDGFTIELRKQQDEAFNHQEAERKAKDRERQLREQKLKDSKNKKQEKISFDYNGQIFNVKADARNNLVGKTIQGTPSQKTATVKEAVNDPNPAVVEGSRTKKQAKKLLKKEQVEFSEMTSLAEDIRVARGIRYSHNALIFEEKTRVIPSLELKKTMSTRRLSKEEYGKVKELAGNRTEFDEQPRKSEPRIDQNLALTRSKSESKVNAAPTKHRVTSITVLNDELKSGMLANLQEQKPYLSQAGPPNEEDQHTNNYKLGTLDNFNLQYLKSGGTAPLTDRFQKTTVLKDISKSKLPKIVHTAAELHTLPKQREKLKESSLIIREIRKKFEEKLRV